MNQLTRLSTLAAVILACHLTLAQTPAKSKAAATPQSSTAAAPKPANATGQCRDGSYSTDATKSGACRGHHGVKEWYAAATTPASPSSSPATAATPASTEKSTTPVASRAPVSPSPTTQVRTQGQAAAQSAGQSDTPPATQSITPSPAPAAAAPASTKTVASSSAKKGPKADLATTPVAPGGGPGLVWVNTASNVYHCPGTDFYGKTKKGAYMTEADAKSKGARGNRGQACTKQPAE